MSSFVRAFYTNWFCSSIDLVAWPLQGEDSREKFQNKDLTKKRKSHFVACELKVEVILFHQFSWRIYRRYIVNFYGWSTRFLLCYFWLRGKLIENACLSLLIISPRSFHNFWNFPRYANRHCTGHASMSTERGNDRLNTAHAPSCHLSPHRPMSQKFLRIPQKNLTQWIHRTEDESKLQFSAIASRRCVHRKNIFLANQRDGFRPLLELVW